MSHIFEHDDNERNYDYKMGVSILIMTNVTLNIFVNLGLTARSVIRDTFKAFWRIQIKCKRKKGPKLIDVLTEEINPRFVRAFVKDGKREEREEAAIAYCKAFEEEFKWCMKYNISLKDTLDSQIFKEKVKKFGFERRRRKVKTENKVKNLVLEQIKKVEDKEKIKREHEERKKILKERT